ncbi:nucleoside-diphosphate kinase [Proteiniclasticum sp. BAD-10]|uniref:Nucleoside diphosphate kinase n=1 Tax=Proteiniclasticum sediminis TaxID=2804028 RepID=A0A941CLQ4_9CLOT|nr:nucleoside-diphosphate kinase [Proteiniclasticum sediminis]MBR0574860.1 nucleoside-diphosphate kinase [Proteiniclasticum sediminis]
MEKTLVLIKPDAVERNLIGKILTVYEEAGLQITALRMLQADLDLARKHYAEHEGRPYFDGLLAEITRGPLVALILEGGNAIGTVRTLNGKTNPKEAAPGTIRARFALDTSHNSVHASDSPENAQREMDLWFPRG